MKAIITRYAMTAGVEIKEGEPEPGDDMGSFVIQEPGEMSQCFFRKDWHTTKREAVDDVLRRFVKKQASLKRALLKLDAKRDAVLKAIEGMEMP